MNQHQDTFRNAGEVITPQVAQWTWWRNALDGKVGPIHADEPQSGYYRVRDKGGQWEPVAIWIDEGSGTLIAYRGGREVRPDDIWTWCCRNPIEYDAYDKAKNGGGFDDEPPAPIGDNSGDADPFEALRIEYLGEKEQAEEFMRQAVTTQAQADKVAIWSKRLTDIAKRADAQREVEKKPHLDAGRAVDTKWRDLKEEPDLLAKRLKQYIKPFLQEQIRAEEERQRKAMEAEAAQRQAEEAELHAKIKAAQAADDRDEQHIAALIEEAEQRASRPTQVDARRVNAGRTGARVSMRKVKVAVVTDYVKAATALIAMKHPDLMEMIHQLAQRAAKASMPFDGMEITEEERVV